MTITFYYKVLVLFDQLRSVTGTVQAISIQPPEPLELEIASLAIPILSLNRSTLMVRSILCRCVPIPLTR